MILDHVAQSVVSRTADSRVIRTILARSYTSVDIDYEIISTVFLLLTLIQEGLKLVTSQNMCTKYWLST